MTGDGRPTKLSGRGRFQRTCGGDGDLRWGCARGRLGEKHTSVGGEREKRERRRRLTVCHVALLVGALAQLVVAVVEARAQAAVVCTVLAAARDALTAAVHTTHAASAEALEAALATGHPAPHGRVYALRAAPAPGLGPVERLEVCFVLGSDGAAVLERGHLLAGLVDIGVWLGLVLLGGGGEVWVVVGAAGEGAA